MSGGSEAGLTRTLVKLVLAAAILTAPVYLFGEGFEAKYVGRVAASNGLCVVLCACLLALIRQGRERLAAGLFVGGLMALVGTLAWVNGEPVHVNVINFTLVAVIASVTTGPRVLACVTALSAVEMCAIAWRRPLPGVDTGALEGEALAEARFEAIAQFLPTYLVVAGILWLAHARRTSASSSPERDERK